MLENHEGILIDLKKPILNKHSTVNRLRFNLPFFSPEVHVQSKDFKIDK